VIQYESDKTSLIEVDPCMHEQPTSIEGVSGLVWKCQDNDPIDIAGGINYRFDAQFRDERGLVLFTGEMDNVSVPPGEIRTLRMMVRPINKVGVDPAFILTENFDTTKETSGDMQIDDLVTINAGSNDISVLLGKGNGVYNSELRIIEGVGEDPVAAQVVDLNEDGYMDLAIVNISFINISERGSITVLLGQGDGTFEPAPDSPFEIGANPIAIAVEDFNKDGSSPCRSSRWSRRSARGAA
jgi:hypothetical protein